MNTVPVPVVDSIAFGWYIHAPMVGMCLAELLTPVPWMTVASMFSAQIAVVWNLHCQNFDNWH